MLLDGASGRGLRLSENCAVEADSDFGHIFPALFCLPMSATKHDRSLATSRTCKILHMRMFWYSSPASLQI